MRALVVVLLAACSSTKLAAKPEIEQTSQKGADAGSAVVANSTDCPAAVPSERAACTSEDLRCVYGEGPTCASLWVCHGSVWQRYAQGSCGNEQCSEAVESRPAVPAGSPVPALACVYADGLFCRYQRLPNPCSGVPQPPPGADWICGHPSLCLAQLRIGDPCVDEGMQCGGGCCNAGLRCEKGRWAGVFGACPP